MTSMGVYIIASSELDTKIIEDNMWPDLPKGVLYIHYFKTHHSIATSIHQQSMRVSMSKAVQYAFAGAGLWAVSDIHGCL